MDRLSLALDVRPPKVLDDFRPRAWTFVYHTSVLFLPMDLKNWTLATEVALPGFMSFRSTSRYRVNFWREVARVLVEGSVGICKRSWLTGFGGEPGKSTTSGAPGKARLTAPPSDNKDPSNLDAAFEPINGGSHDKT